MTAGREPVGFIGLGVMGSILAGRLRDAGFPLVVWNRTKARADPLERRGAVAAASPAELGRSCQRVFTALSGSAALHEALFGCDGLCAGEPVATRVVCNLGTDDPQALRSMAARLRAHGIVLVESPMAGSVHDATQGTLQMLHGGDRASLRELAPCFRCWGPAPVHFGALGSAATAKLALNLVLGLMSSGLADAVALLRRSGVSEEAFISVLGASGLRSPLYERLWARHAAGDYAARFSLANLEKDVELAASHPAWNGAAPETVAALARRIRSLPPDMLASDYSRLLQEDAVAA